MPYFSIPPPLYWIEQVAFNDGKMYITSTKDLYIYAADSLNLIFTKSGTFQNIQLILGENNINFIVYQNGLEASLNSFENDGAKFTDLGKIKLPTNSSKPIFQLKSGRFITKSYLGIFYSDDFGKTWIKTPLLSSPYDLTINKKNKVIVSYREDVVISDDELNSWKTFPIYLNSLSKKVFFNDSTKSIMYSIDECNRAKLVISDDFGETWKNEDINIDAPLSYDFLVTKEENVINASCIDGLNEVKLNNSSRWESFLIDNKFVPSKILTLKSGKLFAVSESAAYTSVDNGKTWQSYNKFLISFSNIFLNQLGELVNYGWYKYRVSKDEGETWDEVSAPSFYIPSNTPYSLLLNDYVFFNTGVFNIYNPHTDSLTYVTKINNEDYLPGTNLVVLNGNTICFPAVVFGSKDFSVNLYFTSDYGKTFSVKKVQGLSLDISICHLRLTKEGYFILLTAKDIYLSKNQGDSWMSIKGNLGLLNSSNFNHFVLSPNDYLYVSTSSNGIFKSKFPLQKLLSVEENQHLESFNFELSPNPISKEIKIQITDNQEDKSTVSIYSIDGRLHSQTQIYGVSTALNVEYLPQGIYILAVENGIKSEKKRFVKY